MNYIFNKSKLLIFQIIFFTLNAAEFNPENYLFSQQSTIKEWVHPSHNSPEAIAYLQSIIAKEMPYTGSADVYGTSYTITNNKEDPRFFGKTFAIITTPQLDFLKYIHARNKEEEKELKVLEIAAAGGSFAVKIAAALKSSDTLYVNDLSAVEINKAYKHFEDIKKNISLKPTIIFDAGDATHFLQRNPTLKNSIDVIYVQNVEHFMNPEEHQLFAKEVLKMLAPHGRLFCVAHTIPPLAGVKGNPFFDCYIQQKKKGNIYPMFIEHKMTNWQILNNRETQIFLPGTKIATAVDREVNDTCFTKGHDTGIREVKEYGNKKFICGLVECTTLMNRFTPTIYKNAYQEASKNSDAAIKIEHAGFLDTTGNFYQYFDNTKNIAFAMAVIQKINNHAPDELIKPV